MDLPRWLTRLRAEEIIDRVNQDPRTSGDLLLGVPRARIFADVLGGGQAEFDAGCGDLSPADCVLLYAYFNQKGHLEELLEAFDQLLSETAFENPVVIDLGCGPFTGGLALASTLGPTGDFTYIGYDSSLAMHQLGEHLARAAIQLGGMANIEVQWTNDLVNTVWPHAPTWRPVLVIVSYLLASPTVQPLEVVVALEDLLKKIGRGPVALLYTNAPSDNPNRKFTEFQVALETKGFELIANDVGSIQISRFDGLRDRSLRYALFRRTAQRVLTLTEEQ